ncbi:hypothetical protein [Amycolatopsis sp. NPDC058986]|uniref:hypothetical protein n=1 Tax=unclassified Amycolatopsis TaxID=2618356 RepID=UPI00366B782E
MDFHHVRNGHIENLTLYFADGQIKTLSPQHVKYHAILAYLTDPNSATSEAYVRELLDARALVMSRLRPLSDRIAFDEDNDVLTFDGDRLDTALSRHIVKALRENNQNELRPAVAFMENLAQNPSAKSRRHLWHWLRDRDLKLTPDGHVIGYKAVQSGPENYSITFGRNQVTVDGKIHTGHIPNPIGAVVSIARSEVDPDRNVGCSTGLHVGTWSYAEQFGAGRGKVLTVSVNPRDVVSVPSDHDDQKMRVCRYTVHEVTDEPHTRAIVAFDLDDDPEHEHDEEYAYA